MLPTQNDTTRPAETPNGVDSVNRSPECPGGQIGLWPCSVCSGEAYELDGGVAYQHDPKCPGNVPRSADEYKQSRVATLFSIISSGSDDASDTGTACDFADACFAMGP